jgi:hypothetical protein
MRNLQKKFALELHFARGCRAEAVVNFACGICITGLKNFELNFISPVTVERDLPFISHAEFEQKVTFAV